ncbi:MAG: glutamate racemase [Acidobacteriota bacterium]
MSDPRPVGIFDSGIGGLTVVKAVLRAMPHERVVYLGDTARLPYGSKSPRTVLAYTQQNLRFLAGRDVKAIVIACNTASAIAIPEIERSTEAPVLGVIGPGARMACARSRTGRIGVLGTRATIQSGAYERAIRTLRPGARVFGQPCPLFVPLAEEGMTRGSVARTVAASYLAPVLAKGVDTLVLGCTHYPLLATTIRAVSGAAVRIVDSATSVASALALLLAERGIARTSGKATLEVYLTDPNPQFARTGRRFLGRALGVVTHVDL